MSNIAFLKECENKIRNIRTAAIRLGFNVYSWSHKVQHTANNRYRIVVLRIDCIGDVLLTSPLLRELRFNYPNAEITLVVAPEIFNLVELCPYVDRILKFPRNRRTMKEIANAFHFAQQYLRKFIFDLALVPNYDATARRTGAWISFFASAKRSIGYEDGTGEERAASDSCYNKILTNVITGGEPKNEVEHNLDVLRFLGCKINSTALEVWTCAEDKNIAHELMSPLLKKKSIKIALLLSTSGRRKEYPLNYYAEAVNVLSTQYEIDIILIGAGSITQNYATEFAHSVSAFCLDLVGKTTLRQTIEVLRLCDCYLGGDTGPMHMADALDLNGVVLFYHPINVVESFANPPIRFGPWQAPLKVLQPLNPLPGCEGGCEKDYAHCITQIPVEEVINSLRQCFRECSHV